MTTKFQEQVYQIVRQIPRGRVMSYQAIAKKLGNKKLARAVGQALNKNPFAPKIPCHRVVYKDGRLGGFKDGLVKKKRILEKEGIKFDPVRKFDVSSAER